ncbi:hypothetical protein PIB30_035686 [Stylosanthes scabra]|uniref:Uncharacterized protein n=1 Tax=Stylosanthes scabra TaxID=79078 RepID=A0ABU6UDF6_9FABA|nr:hypothetical protein [Stylosanthes scabra]
MDTEKQTILEENLSDSEEELEANYEVDDKDEDDEEDRAIVALQNSIDFAAMNASEFAEREKMAVAAPDDGEFMVRMEYSSRKSIISAIRSYSICRGVDYAVYEPELQTFYAKCKSY